MMHLFDRGKPSVFETQLAQRMLRSVAVTDTLPRSAIGLVYLGSPFILVVVPSYHSFVIGTVL